MLGPQASNATALSEAHTGAATVHSCGHSALHPVEEDAQSYGNSPRAARSQISTAVSFEGAKPAGSAAVAARSADEDSAHSVADPEGENSSVPAAQPQSQQFMAQPTTSLLSTAVRNTSPPPRAPGSPDLYRASSVVSHTEAGHQARAARAGTPASVYAQGRVLPTPRTRPSSPQTSQAGEQYSGSGEARQSARSSRRLQGAGRGSGSRAGRRLDVQTSLLASAGHPMLPTQSLRRHSPPPENNSIEAVQCGDSQDGQGGVGSAEGPLHRNGTGSGRQADSFAHKSRRTSQGACRTPLQQPGDASVDRHAISRAVLNMQSALKGLRAASPVLEVATSRTASEALPGLLLQHQGSAVLGSGLLTSLKPFLQQHPPHPTPGLQTHGSVNTKTSIADLPRPTGGITSARQMQRFQLPGPDMWPREAGQSVLGGDSPQQSQQLRQHSMADAPGPPQQQMSIDQDHPDSVPQQATHQEVGGVVGMPSDAEMAGASQPGCTPATAEHEQSVQAASPSQLAGVSLPSCPASSNSGGSHQLAGSARAQRTASQAAAADDHGTWEAPAVQAADSGWNVHPTAALQEQIDSQEEAAQPTNSVLGTLVNADGVSDMENDADVKSLQPSLSQGSLQQPSPGVQQEPSYRGSILPTPSGEGEAAFAVATEIPAVPHAVPNLGLMQPQDAMQTGDAFGSEQRVSLSGEGAVQAEGEASVPAARPLESHETQKAESQPLFDALTNGAIPPAGTGSAIPSMPVISHPTLPAGAVATMEECHNAGLPPLHPGTSDRATSRLTAASSPGHPGLPAPAGGAAAADSLTSVLPAQVVQLQDMADDLNVEASHSDCFPASATVRSGLETGTGAHDTVAQSQPQLGGHSNPPGPQPALTIVVQGGLLGPSSEPDDGAAGPTGMHSMKTVSNGISGHSSAYGKATSAITSPTQTPVSGRSKREASKRKRASPSHASNC